LDCGDFPIAPSRNLKIPRSPNPTIADRQSAISHPCNPDPQSLNPQPSI